MPGNFSCVLIGIASILFDKLWIEAYNIQCYKDKKYLVRSKTEGLMARVFPANQGGGGRHTGRMLIDDNEGVR